ncbi:MAG: tetratricopeptide repeat protein [Pseudomonadota bacterium]|nr:tetratricopeptide repeat protein [Pseudomonadota bacterium]
MRSLVTIIFFFFPLSIFANTIEPSLSDAQKAFQDGKQLEAFEIWNSLADSGDIVAMNNLGYLYEKGVVVEKDLKKSLDFYKKAAEQGFPTAQYNVGEIYAEGRGVKRNKVIALKWFILAGTRGDKDAQNYYEKIFNSLTKEEVEEANKLAKDWKIKKRK